MIHVAYLEAMILIHLAWKAQISLLLVKKIFVSIECLNYTNVFLKELAIKLSKWPDNNKHSINLESNYLG